MRSFVLCAIVFCTVISGSGISLAQRPGGRRPQATDASGGKTSQMPTDPQLLELHKEFVAKAEKLAAEYERKKDLSRAREVYESLTRLLPEYEAANKGLSRILSAQSAADRKIVDVQSNRDWQDTGVNIVAGNPVKIETQGTWQVVSEVGPDGLVIPKEMDPKNSRIKIGTLIGIIANKKDLKEHKPFVIGSGTEFIAKESGRLIMRMFDVDLSDNRGTVSVRIQSTFGR